MLQNPHPPAFSAQWQTTWRSCLTGWTPSWQQTNEVSSLMSPPWYRHERGAGHEGQKGPYLYGVHGHKGISGDQFCLPKPANNATRRSWLDKFVLPLGDKTCCPKRNSLIKGELSKEALEAHRKLSRLQNFTLNAAAPLVAALEKLTEKKEHDSLPSPQPSNWVSAFWGMRQPNSQSRDAAKPWLGWAQTWSPWQRTRNSVRHLPSCLGQGSKRRPRRGLTPSSTFKKLQPNLTPKHFPHLTMAQHLGNGFFSWHPLPLQVPRQEWQQEQLLPTPLPQQRTPRSQTECCSQEGLNSSWWVRTIIYINPSFFQKSFSKTYFNTNRGTGMSREWATSASHSSKMGHLAQYTHNRARITTDPWVLNQLSRHFRANSNAHAGWGSQKIPSAGPQARSHSTGRPQGCSWSQKRMVAWDP